MKLSMIVLIAAVAVALTGCSQPPANITTSVVNTSSVPAAEPNLEVLKALEVRAFQAYKNKDTMFFEAYLDQKFVSYSNGNKIDRAAVLKEISEHKNNIKAFTLSDEKMTRLGASTALLTLKASADGTSADGEKIPDVISATLFVRQGTDWRVAWHGEVPIVDPKAMTPSAKPDLKIAGKAALTASNTASGSTANVETDALQAIERSVWEAWAKRDGNKLDALTAKELAFVNIFGGYFTNRADTLKDWTEHKCEIKNVVSSDASSVAVTSDTAILFHKATGDGTCSGQKLGSIFGTSIYVKEGTIWKLAFTMNTPAA